jgi:histidinol-phosphate phosphatase family protein
MTSSEWTLFLDRDGVINAHPSKHYVFSWDDFNFCPGVLEALSRLSTYFSRIIIVTNQQGIGKGLMTEEDLNEIHSKLCQTVEATGGRIDAILHCSELNTIPNNCRKPSPHMAHLAKEKFPDIVFEKSYMVGDQLSDIRFGSQLGMSTVLIHNEHVDIPLKDRKAADFSFNSLKDFADHIL